MTKTKWHFSQRTVTTPKSKWTLGFSDSDSNHLPRWSVIEPWHSTPPSWRVLDHIAVHITNEYKCFFFTAFIFTCIENTWLLHWWKIMKGLEAKNHTMCHSSEWVVNFYPSSRLIKQGSNPWLQNMVKKKKKRHVENILTDIRMAVWFRISGNDLFSLPQYSFPLKLTINMINMWYLLWSVPNKQVPLHT